MTVKMNIDAAPMQLLTGKAVKIINFYTFTNNITRTETAPSHRRDKYHNSDQTDLKKILTVLRYSML